MLAILFWLNSFVFFFTCLVGYININLFNINLFSVLCLVSVYGFGFGFVALALKLRLRQAQKLTLETDSRFSRTEREASLRSSRSPCVCSLVRLRLVRACPSSWQATNGKQQDRILAECATREREIAQLQHCSAFGRNPECILPLAESPGWSGLRNADSR